MEQMTNEWFAARLGKVTASNIAAVVGKKQNGEYYIARQHYMERLLNELLTGVVEQSEPNEHMLRGIQLEPYARKAYEQETGNPVVEVGFIEHECIKQSGASPDGLVGEHGMIEIKCPTEDNHLKTIMTKGDTINLRYIYQMQWQMACTGRAWVDFVSYNLDVYDDLQFFCKRINRDDAMISMLETEVIKFINELNALYEARKATNE